MMALKMVEIPGGEFEMGGRVEDKFVSFVELPRRKVRVDGFRISETVVTRGEWAEVMGSGKVCEWVNDFWHPSYLGAPCDGTAWLGGK